MSLSLSLECAMNFFDGHLPEPYMKFVSEKQKQMPKKGWPASNLPKEIQKDLVDAELQLYYFGHHIEDCFNKTRSYINDVINPKYINPENLPSDLDEKQWLLMMRKELATTTNYKRSYKNLYKQHSVLRKKVATTPEWNSKDPATMDRIKGGVKAFNIDEYEDCWLAFLFLGLPANANCRDSLKSGQAVRDANSQSAIAQSKKFKTGGGTTPDSASKEADKVSITHVHKITVSTEELQYLALQTKNMNSNRRSMLRKSLLELREKSYNLDMIANNPDEPNHKREGARNYSAQVAKQADAFEAELDLEIL